MKLSVIIPVYNVEKYLRECLDSVLPPKEELGEKTPGEWNYEVITVNDGSTDASAEILKEYEAVYGPAGLLTIVTKENGGLGSARNAGLPLAKGEYIFFLDSDDTVSDHGIPEILETCSEQFDICIFNFRTVNEKGEPIKCLKGCSEASLSAFPVNNKTGRTNFFSLADNPGILFELPSATNKLFRRSLLLESNFSFPPRCWFEDLHSIPKLYPTAKKICYIDRDWYIYRQQPSSITHGKNTERNLEIIDAVEEIVSYYRKNNYAESCANELEYMVYYNELLTSTDRVNLIDPHSPVQKKLLDYMRREFPNYKSNPYYLQRPAKYKLLDFFIEHQLYGLLHLTLRLNNRVQGK